MIRLKSLDLSTQNPSYREWVRWTPTNSQRLHDIATSMNSDAGKIVVLVERSPTLVKWGAASNRTDRISYAHMFGITPLGRFLITWKAHKENPRYEIEDMPWGTSDYRDSDPELLYSEFVCLEEAKLACEIAYYNIIQKCLGE